LCARCGHPVSNFPGWLARTSIKAICDQCRSGHPPLTLASEKIAGEEESPEALSSVSDGEEVGEVPLDEPLDLESEDEGIVLDDAVSDETGPIAPEEI